MPAPQNRLVSDVVDAAAFEAEHYWWKVLIPTMRYSSPGTRT